MAFFAFKYGRIDWLESNNEYWLEKDARLRTDFNIKSGFQIGLKDCARQCSARLCGPCMPVKSAKEKSIGNLKKLKKDEGAKRVQQKDRRRNAGLGRNYRRTQMCPFGTGPEGSSSLARYSFTLP